MHSDQDLPGLWAGDAAWADHDGDGDLTRLVGQALNLVRVFRQHLFLITKPIHFLKIGSD